MSTALIAPSAPADRPYVLRHLTPLPAPGADQPPAPESRYDADRQIVVGGMTLGAYSTMARRRGTPVPETDDRPGGGADSWW
ncbi:hypothetical protein [Streptomyces chrestomyceticus]|uniref:hypothetical protein n=1 Tax=Streptomyces chrestomyceticus TaxID=68185 RepID=UPI0033C8E0AD